MGLSLEFRVRSVSLLPGSIFSKLWSNVHLWDDVQNTNSAMGTEGQGHSSRSRVRVQSISPLPLEGFSFNFGQMRYVLSCEMMCRIHSSTMKTHKVTVQGHRFEP